MINPPSYALANKGETSLYATVFSARGGGTVAYLVNLLGSAILKRHIELPALNTIAILVIFYPIFM